MRGLNVLHALPTDRIALSLHIGAGKPLFWIKYRIMPDRRGLLVKGRKVDDYVMPVPQRDTIFILEPLCTKINFHNSIKDDVFYVNDERLYDIEEMDNTLEYTAILRDNLLASIKSGKPIIFFTYFPPIALGLKAYTDILNAEKHLYTVNCFTFFYNDRETKEFKQPKVAMDTLELKKMILNSLEEFPFIKKFTIPADLRIDHDYLLKLSKDKI